MRETFVISQRSASSLQLKQLSTNGDDIYELPQIYDIYYWRVYPHTIFDWLQQCRERKQDLVQHKWNKKCDDSSQLKSADSHWFEPFEKPILE